jgi:hypothetical protein
MKVRCEGHEKFGLSFKVETKILLGPHDIDKYLLMLGVEIRIFMFKTARHGIMA